MSGKPVVLVLGVFFIPVIHQFDLDRSESFLGALSKTTDKRQLLTSEASVLIGMLTDEPSVCMHSVGWFRT